MDIDEQYFKQFFNEKTGKEHYARIRKDAFSYVKNHDIKECRDIALKWYENETYYIQMWAVYVMGAISSVREDVFVFLRDVVSQNSSWQVQESLAQAFDNYCSANGYKESLQVINDWLNSEEKNVRRAASEGLRVWTKRDYFHEHPTLAISMLSRLRNDDSEYVRKSAGNALKDISKEYPDLVKQEIATWDIEDKSVKQVFRLASKLLNK